MDDDPLLLEARKHMAEANRNGRIAFQALLFAIGALIVNCWTIEQSWTWWLWVAWVVALVRMTLALKERWFHRKAARIALEFYAYSKRG